MTLLEMRDYCRFEAQIKGSDTMVGFINGIINSTLKQYTGRAFYQELLMTNQVLANPGAGIQNWVLPTTIQHWLPDSIRFSEGGSYDEARGLYSGTFGNINAGPAYRFRRAGGILQLWPYADLSTLGAVWLDYYRYPTTLAADADVFPIVSLEDTVISEVVSRLSRFADTDRSKVFKAESQEDYSASLAQENRANAEGN